MPAPRAIIVVHCGERGIRTPGGVTLSRFQGDRTRPLCELSVNLGVSRDAVGARFELARVSPLLAFQASALGHYANLPMRVTGESGSQLTKSERAVSRLPSLGILGPRRTR